MRRDQQPHIKRCFAIDEDNNIPPPRNSSVEQCAPGLGKRVDVRRLAAVSANGGWWNPTTQELVAILPEDHPDHRQNQELIHQAIKRWSGEPS